MPKAITLEIGSKFGRLRVVGFERHHDTGRLLSVCTCDCGDTIKVRSYKLQSGHTKSCGCLRREVLLDRCTGSNHYDYKGGKENVGSVAWANVKLASARGQARRHGFAAPNGSASDVVGLWRTCGGRCLICGRFSVLHLDHCHSSGAIRGFLCADCNRAIGMFRDDPTLLRSAAKYLECQDRSSGRIPVYISGPMSLGDRVENLAMAMKAMRELIALGYAPLCPQLTFFAEPFMDASHADWIDVDIPWVRSAKAVLRLLGDSRGADREVAAATAAGVPVFAHVRELHEHFAPSVKLAVFDEDEAVASFDNGACHES